MPSPSDRRPWLAALLNIFFPGLGALYCGDPRGTIFWALVPAIALGITAIAVLCIPPSLLSAVLFIAIQIVALGILGAAGWRLANSAPVPFVPGPLNRWYWYWGFAAAVTWGYLSGVRPLFRQNLIQAYRLPSESMSPTLIVGDFIVVDRRSTFQERAADGDLVVFHSVEEPELEVLKRVAGTPGDTIEMRHGVLYRDGSPQRDDPFVDTTPPAPLEADFLHQMRTWQTAAFAGPVPPGYTPDPSNWGPISVPRGSFFALGDNRAHSWDSRYYGLVPIQNVLGRPRLIYWNKFFLLPGNLGRIGMGPK